MLSACFYRRWNISWTVHLSPKSKEKEPHLLLFFKPTHFRLAQKTTKWSCVLAWNLTPPCILRHLRRVCPVWNSHGPRGWNLLENRAHMVASVSALTCHVTAVMGLSMAAQTAGSQEPVSCGSWGRGWEDEVPWSAGRSKITIGDRGGQGVIPQVRAYSRAAIETGADEFKLGTFISEGYFLLQMISWQRDKESRRRQKKRKRERERERPFALALILEQLPGEIPEIWWWTEGEKKKKKKKGKEREKQRDADSVRERVWEGCR